MRLEFETDAGLGTRATFGAIVLSTDETLESEFARIMDLDGVVLHHSRIPMVPEIKSETLAKMLDDLPKAASLLPTSAHFDVIGYGCTSGSTVIGSGQVAEAIKSVFPKAQVTDPLAAIIAAGKALKVKSPGFLTPYVPEVSTKMRHKLEDAGFSITGFGSFEEGDDRVVAKITGPSIASAAKQIARQADCDAIIISCTNLRCLHIIPEVEAAIGIPVISSNQAMAWHMIRLAGIEDALLQFGALFDRQI